MLYEQKTLYMELKELDKRLKEVVDKYEKLLPQFNSGNQKTDLINRLKYTKEDVHFYREFNSHIYEYLEEKNLSIEQKERMNFLTGRYETKYNYGFNFPSSDEIYKSLF